MDKVYSLPYAALDSKLSVRNPPPMHCCQDEDAALKIKLF